MPVEIDFLGLEKQQPSPSNTTGISSQQRPSSIGGDIQTTMVSPSPHVLRSVLAGNTRTSAPLTILYNGTISVFDATNDVAEDVMKMAAEGARQLQLQQQNAGFPFKDYYFNTNRDMPLLRKKSLQRFLEKRRERLASLAPYTASLSSTSEGEVDGPVQPIATDAHKKHLQRPDKTKGLVGRAGRVA